MMRRYERFYVFVTYVPRDNRYNGHESYVSRIIFRVKEFEKKIQLGLKYLWTEENIYHVTGNILCHGHDLRESYFSRIFFRVKEFEKFNWD